MYFVFQPSKIWEGSSDNVDKSKEKVRIKAKSEDKARKRLPAISTGRQWVLVDQECPKDPKVFDIETVGFPIKENLS